MDYDVREVAVDTVIADIAPMIQPQISAKGLTLETRPSTACVVRADRGKLQQILLNLLSNALKFTPTGGRVTIDCVVRNGVDDRIFLRVSDTGRGIARQELEAIFAPFAPRVPPQAPVEGVGVGLAISRGLARGMGGDLRARSVEGHGSTLTVTLPRARARS
ncbi:MAG: ATP-binding protein [Gemmatimonadaceae bacterium]